MDGGKHMEFRHDDAIKASTRRFKIFWLAVFSVMSQGLGGNVWRPPSRDIIKIFQRNNRFGLKVYPENVVSACFYSRNSFTQWGNSSLEKHDFALKPVVLQLCWQEILKLYGLVQSSFQSYKCSNSNKRKLQ